MYLTKKENKNLLVKKSRNGRGIFAKKDFLPEEIIFEVTGEFTTCDLEDEMDEKTRANTYRYDKKLYISPKGRVGDFLNHSCNPNSKVAKNNGKLFIVSIGSIPKNTECTIDYSTILATDDIWEMKCNCGSKNCRGIVKEIGSLPKKTIKKYLVSDMIPDYILN